MTSTPPGWYEDPAGSGRLRYWSGAAWTEHYAVAMAPPPPSTPPLPPATPPGPSTVPSGQSVTVGPDRPGDGRRFLTDLATSASNLLLPDRANLPATADDEAYRTAKGRRLVFTGLTTSAASLLFCPIVGSVIGAALAFAGRETTPAGRRASLGNIPRATYILSLLGILGWFTAIAISAASTPAEQRLASRSAATTTEAPPRTEPTTTSAPTPATTIAVPTDPAALLGALRVAPEHDPGRYDRDAFNYPQGGTDTRGCNTRARVLQRDSTVPAQVDYPGCKVLAGRWVDTYTGATHENPGDVSIDHVVPLKEAYRSGAASWSTATLEAFANDVDRVEALKVIGGSGNAAKGDSDPARWKPPLRTAWPDYARAWLVVKVAYGLTADQAEVDALRDMLITPPPPPPAAPPPTAAAPPPPAPAPATTRRPATTRQPATTQATAPPTPACHPSYKGACLPPNATDVDCAGGKGDGPVYTGRVEVVGPDEYGLDSDGDGDGCENS